LGITRDTIKASTMVVQKNKPTALVVRHKQDLPSRFNSSKSKAATLFSL